MKKTIGSMSYVGSTAAISQLLVMIQSFLLARFLGPEKYGFIAAALAITTLTSIIIDGGMDTWLLHRGSLTDHKADLANQVFAIKLVLSFFWGIPLLLVATKLRPAIYLPPVIALTIVAVAIDAYAKTVYTFYFITDRFKESSLILVVSRFVRVLGTIVLISIASTNPVHYLLLRAIIDLLFFIILLIRSGIRLKFVKPANLTNTFKKALPYGYSEVLSTIYNQSDVNLVSLISSNLQVISYFSIAINIVNAVFAVIQTLQNVIIPKLAVTFEKNWNRFNENSRRVGLGFLLIGVITWFGISAFGSKLIVNTLGVQYSNAFNILKNISGIFILRSLVMALTSLLIATNNQTRRFTPQIFAVITKVVTGIFAISRLGVASVPLPYLISEMVLLAGLGAACSKWVWKSHSNKREAV